MLGITFVVSLASVMSAANTHTGPEWSPLCSETKKIRKKKTIDKRERERERERETERESARKERKNN